MSTTPPLNINVTANVTDLEQALGSQATAAVKSFGSAAQVEFDKVTTAAKKPQAEIDNLGKKLRELGDTQHSVSQGQVSDMVKAENAWLLFDRTFRLGIDREMMTVLNAFPVLKSFLAMLGGTPATLGILLGFMALRGVIDELTKMWDEYKEKVAAAIENHREFERSTQELAVATDQMELSLAQAEMQLEKTTTGYTSAEAEARVYYETVVTNADKYVEGINKDIEALRRLLGTEQEIRKAQEDASGFHFFGDADTAKTTTLIAGITTEFRNLIRGFEDGIAKVKEFGDAQKLLNAQVDDAKMLDELYQSSLTTLNARIAENAEKMKQLNEIIKETGIFGVTAQLQLAELATQQDRLKDSAENLTAAYNKEKVALQETLTQDKLKAAQQAESLAGEEAGRITRQASAEKAVSLERIKIEEDAAKNSVKLHEVTQDQLTAALIEGENERYAVIQANSAREIAAANMTAEGKKRVTELQAQAQVDQLEHQSKTEQLLVDQRVRNQKLQDDATLRTISTQETSNSILLSEQTAHEHAMLSMHQVTAEQVVAFDIATAEKSLSDFKEAAAAKKAVYATQQEEGAKLAAALDAETVRREQETAKQIETINDQAAVRLYERQKEAFEAEMSLEMSRAQRQYAATQQRVGAGGAETSGSRGIRQEIEALDELKAKQDEVMTAKYAAIDPADVAAYTKWTEEKEELDAEYVSKKLALDQKLHQSNKQMLTGMTSDFNSTIDKWLTGQGRMTTNWRNMADQMGLQMSNMLLSLIEKEAAMLAKKLLMHVMTNAGIVADAQASSSATALITKESSIKEIFAAANTAAAKAWKAYAEFPPVAAALAAGTWAAVMAYAAFEEGGVVRGAGYQYGTEVPILATPGERVLSVEQTGKFHQLVDQHSKEGSDRNMHFHYSPQIQGIDGKSVESMARSHARVWERQTNRMLRVKGLIQ